MSQNRPPDTRSTRVLALEIARDLFANELGVPADSLIQCDENRKRMGGWSMEAAVERIKDTIDDVLTRRRK